MLARQVPCCITVASGAPNVCLRSMQQHCTRALVTSCVPCTRAMVGCCSLSQCWAAAAVHSPVLFWVAAAVQPAGGLDAAAACWPLLLQAAAVVQLAGSLDTTAHIAASTWQQSGVLPTLHAVCRPCCSWVEAYTQVVSPTALLHTALHRAGLNQAACRHCGPLMHLNTCVHPLSDCLQANLCTHA